MRHKRVVLLQSARDDLGGMYNYIRQQGGLGKTGKAYIRRIQDRCRTIGEVPFGGVSRDDLGPGIRMTVFERSVVILYTVDDDTVSITNIISGGRDYEALFDRRANVSPEDPV